MSLNEYQVSVRRLVEFTHRSGDLHSPMESRWIPRNLRAWEGSRAHRQLQKTRPAQYEPEVALSHTVRTDELALRITGRIDGILRRDEGTLLEEIKSVTSRWDCNPDPLHWVQIKVYAWILCQTEPHEELELQLSYVQLETGEVTVFRERFSLAVLREFSERIINQYLEWITDYDRWIRLRNQSIHELKFPYPMFREGQRSLCRAVYKAVLDSRKLFVEAPTGLGKTISTLFPAIKTLPSKPVDHIFFLTARNTTQQLAEKAIADMTKAGLRFRSITLSAREKVCVVEGKPCDAVQCPFSKGYFDRCNAAIREALAEEQITGEKLIAIAQRHQVCPHELSLDVSEWVDAIICDYNYAFDPAAHIKRHFDEAAGRYVLLIDEAHNLLDRAREMFSAELTSTQATDAKREAKGTPLPRHLTAIEKAFRDLDVPNAATAVLEKPPAALMGALETFIEKAEAHFAENAGAAIPEPLLDCYFSVNTFLQIAELIDASYRVIVERQGDDYRIRLLCLDPSAQLQSALKRVESAIFFSATLTPLHYFRAALGGSEEDLKYKIPSPFPPENLQVIAATGIRTTYKERTGSMEQVAQTLTTFIKARRGNYLVFFPSYAYLNDIAPRVQELIPEVEIICQTNAMDDAARLQFLNAFDVQSERTLAGFAVMGGIFGEGIDLIGDRLIGVAVVGLGLPQVGLDRNLIRDYFDQQGVDGFDYAYLFPGLNRVFQAAGRLIRSESDRGVVLLIDHRFTEARVRNLLPNSWQIALCKKTSEIEAALKRFWNV